ncbi:MAG: UDP-N-acetylmuramate:L-alanyl-gamma-D-glutamyl-meso-diaminopimelate ligase, partial [Deltaproteobacteria bacterium]|nr:UDP-N-acetylmuramate:L-alanyl-gamma-D-glutamyl-meso-diaminopimelate ligase [Deltaproteobacteria bacterium]
RTGQSPGFLVGGILKNFGKSYQLGSGDYFVVEGDEYDSAFFDKKAKFLHYHPQILILNAVEFDHADIYKDLDAVMAAFSELIQKMAPSGLIVADGSNANVKKLLTQAPCRVMTFGLEEKVGVQNFEPLLRATKIEFGEKTRFQFSHGDKELGVVTTPLAGRHNLKNLLGVIGVLLELGIPLTEINAALAEFQGVKRRQEELGTIDGVTVIDDFAHHPTAVRETLAALRSKYRGRLWAIFEPRSNTTRRKVFEKDFATAFDDADEIIFAAPYLPEKIPQEERLEPVQVVEAMKKRGKKARYLPSVEEIVRVVLEEKKSGDVICIMSNGGFGGIHAKLLQK